MFNFFLISLWRQVSYSHTFKFNSCDHTTYNRYSTTKKSKNPLTTCSIKRAAKTELARKWKVIENNRCTRETQNTTNKHQAKDERVFFCARVCRVSQLCFKSKIIFFFIFSIYDTCCWLVKFSITKYSKVYHPAAMSWLLFHVSILTHARQWW